MTRVSNLLNDPYSKLLILISKMYPDIVFDIINLTSLNSVERSMDGFTFYKKELMALISDEKKKGF